MILMFFRGRRLTNAGLLGAAGVAWAVLAGCGAVSPAAPASLADGRLSVVVGFYPFQYLAEQVGGDHVRVTNLTQPGAEPHDVELTARQVAAVAEADLVVYESGLQQAVDDAIQQGQPARRLDVATVVELLPAAETEQVAGEAAPAGNDPHVWLDPIRFQTIAQALAGALAAADPDHAADYQSRAADLDARLAQLDQAYSQGLKQCQRSVFITSHAAFGYLALRYGLTQEAITGLSPDAEPSPARIAALQDLARRLGVTTIFFETLASPALAQAIAGDLGLETAVLDPIEGLTDQSAAQDYLGLMQANLQALRKANGCV